MTSALLPVFQPPSMPLDHGDGCDHGGSLIASEI